MIDFNKLKQKYGTHEKAAIAMGISARTYFTWKLKSQKKESLSSQATALIERHIADGGLSGKGRKKSTST